MKKEWNLDKIKAAIERFKKEYSRYPSTVDFDKTDYLPTSKMIQRSFGGITKLRSDLRLDISSDFRKGKTRSSKAKETYYKAVKYEEEFYKFLITKIPEVRVHEHKILRPGHVCCDFYVYTSNTRGVAIDIFYAQDIFSVAGVVNIKQKRYRDLPSQTIFVLVGNESISQVVLEGIEAKKKNKLFNIRLMTELYFKQNAEKILSAQ